MTFINNVSHENGNKTTAPIHFVNLFHFTQKSKQAFYSGLTLKNLPKKLCLKWVFLGFSKFFIF